MIYLAERTDEADYEENRAAVVRASSEKNARAAVAELGNGFRADGSNFTVRSVLASGVEWVVLIDSVGS
jgi:hypothetical protein